MSEERALRAVLVIVQFNPFDADRLRSAVPGVQTTLTDLSRIAPAIAWRSTSGELVAWLIASALPLRAIRAQIESPGHRGGPTRWPTLTSADTLSLLEVLAPDDALKGTVSVWFRKLSVELSRNSSSRNG